jgi:predicted metalloprotease with PDZ domain
MAVVGRQSGLDSAAPRGGSAGEAGVAYGVRVLPERHEIEVTMTIRGPAAQGSVRLQTPTWVPGDYVFAPFARDIFALRAHAADGAELVVRRDGWQGYVVEGARGLVRIDYTACCASWESSEACGILGDRVGVLTGARYLNVAAAEGPVTVSYELPDGWSLHHPSGASELGARTWEYPSYEVLLDTPVAMGSFALITHVVRGTPFHHVHLDRAAGFDSGIERFVEEVDAVASYYHDMFGSFPFESYTFVCASNSNVDWGLEHLTSTMVGLEPGMFIDADVHKTAVRVCAHELFHAWNVRRLRPAPLDRLDFSRGSFSEGLWVAEGFTRYYEFLSCTRTGVYSPQQFLSAVVNYYRHLVALPAYERVSAVDSSLATFLNHGQRFPGHVNNTIDYYDKGLVIAFCLDATLRIETPTSTLDRAFASFYERHVGRGLGYAPEDLRDFFEEIDPGLGERIYREASQPGGLALCEQLARLGFEVELEIVGHLGLVMLDDAGPAICDVLDTSPAGQSGIAPGDVITEVDGHPFELGALKWAIAHCGALRLAVLRGSEPRLYEIAIGKRTQIAHLRWMGSEEQARRIATWLDQDFAPARGAEIPLDFYENFHGIQTVI